MKLKVSFEIHCSLTDSKWLNFLVCPFSTRSMPTFLWLLNSGQLLVSLTYFEGGFHEQQACKLLAQLLFRQLIRDHSQTAVLCKS